jgi:hypothetical protein
MSKRYIFFGNPSAALCAASSPFSSGHPSTRPAWRPPSPSYCPDWQESRVSMHRKPRSGCHAGAGWHHTPANSTLCFCLGMWWRRSWFSLKGMADTQCQARDKPPTLIRFRALPSGSVHPRSHEIAICSGSIGRHEKSHAAICCLCFEASANKRQLRPARGRNSAA